MSSSTASPSAVDRMPAAERRELILAAASEVFGTFGYSGATTAQIAAAAGISQPYVVRVFGSKEKLFLEVLERALSKLMIAFRAALADARERGDSTEDTLAAMGRAYVDLVDDRGILLSLMQGFVTGHDEVVGAAARQGFMAIYRLLRDEAQVPPAQIVPFLADGMLINTLMAIGLPANCGTDSSMSELMEQAFGGKVDAVLRSAGA